MVAALKAAELVSPEVDKPTLSRQPVAKDRGTGVGDEDLARAGEPSDAGGAVRRRPPVVTVAFQSFACMHSHANLDPTSARPLMVAKSQLRGDSGGGGVCRVREHAEGAVALAPEPEKTALFRGHSRFDDLVVRF